MRARWIAPLLAFLPLGCVGLQGEELWEAFRAASPESRDRTVEELLARKPLSALPLRLGIAPPITHGRDHGRGDVDVTGWRPRERERLDAWCRDLRGAGVISSHVFLPAISIDGRASEPAAERLDELRKLGARHRVDALLLVNALGDYERGLNPLCILDLTIVGMFVVPGHDSEAITVLEATLIDVRNEFVFVSGIGEGHLEESHPLAELDPAAFLARSRERALERALEDLIAQVPELRETWIVERRPASAGENARVELPRGSVYRTER